MNHDAQPKAAAEEHHAAKGVIDDGRDVPEHRRLAAAVEQAHACLHQARWAVTLADWSSAVGHAGRAVELLRSVGVTGEVTTETKTPPG